MERLVYVGDFQPSPAVVAAILHSPTLWQVAARVAGCLLVQLAANRAENTDLVLQISELGILEDPILQGKSIRKNLYETGFGNDFFLHDTKAQAIKEKADKLGFTNVKNFVHRISLSREWKDNPQNGKRYL